MAALIRWNPRSELEPFTGDPLFRRFFDLLDESREEDRIWSPALDLTEEKDRLVVKVEIPGIEPKDIEVNVQGNVLTIRGARRPESLQKEEGKYLRREQIYGAFQRALQLPYRVVVDKVKATCQNGIMTITLPKVEEHVGRQIPIEVK